ncbi:MAG: ATPase [Gammaproteobacteria bacterium]|nr:ATPase [Gammaproteobacteria bacterium]
MSDCCSDKPAKAPEPPASVSSSCCPQPAAPAADSCCAPADSAKTSFDWLLWGSASAVGLGYALHVFGLAQHFPAWVQTMSHGMHELINSMWWGVVLAAIFVGVLGRIPQNLITSVLGKGGTFRGVWRATLAGVFMDLCSHGILMVGMQLYQRGASLGQVMAFLIASPWNSLSLTIIMVTLIGLPWTLAFILLSLVIALISGSVFDRLVTAGTLPANPASSELPENYRFWPELKGHWAQVDWRPGLVLEVLQEGARGSRMVLRWLLFGVVLATLLRSFVSLENFQDWFGPTMVGLLVTLVMATIIEVCSEGSTPIAADLLTRANAPGNSFAFMMTGVATDYTEVMVLKDTTSSWKIALFLPLVTVPQVIVIALLLNGF